MNYSILTEEDLKKRLNEVPDSIVNALNSESLRQNLKRIYRPLNLDDERQLMLEQLTALTLMGFVSIDDLKEEIKFNLDLDENAAQKLNEDIKLQILRPYLDDLKRIYSPIEETGAELWEKKTEETIPEIKLPTAPPTAPTAPTSAESAFPAPSAEPETKTMPGEKFISLEKFGQPKIPETHKIPVAPQIISDESKEKPLIIHEEKSPVEAVETPTKPKGFNLPFNIFKSGLSKIIKPPVTAKIEAPPEIQSPTLSEINKKEEKKVVHYSELRTPLTPLHREEELINLETLEKVKKPPTDAKPQIDTNLPIKEEDQLRPSPISLSESPQQTSPKPMFIINENQKNADTDKNAAPLSVQKPPLPPFKPTEPPKPPEIPKTNNIPEKPAPKLDGNVIDLR